MVKEKKWERAYCEMILLFHFLVQKIDLFDCAVINSVSQSIAASLPHCDETIAGVF